MAIETEQAGTTTELEFRIEDQDCLFVTASDQANCYIKLEEMIQRSDSSLLEYFTVRGTSPDQILTAANDSDVVTEARLVREEGGEQLFEFLISGLCAAATLADAGAVIRTLYATNGQGYVLADVPAHIDTREVIATFQDHHPTSDLIGRRECNRPRPEFTKNEFKSHVFDVLTDRQREVMEVAYKTGYFTWPRESSATECAEILGIAQSTFSQHLQVGERKLLRTLFDDSSLETLSNGPLLDEHARKKFSRSQESGVDTDS